MNRIIEKLKKARRQKAITRRYKSSYAFVGMGGHSINNLYPVIDFLDVSLKYIVTKSTESAKLISDNHSPIIGIDNLETVLNDKDIKGVFVCTSPSNHFSLTSKILKHKNVFVEKPPCLTIEELKELDSIAKDSGNTCLIGLQKRYSKCTSILRKRLKSDNVISYNYKFAVGAYPEGDPIYDLFIHPIDLVCSLFGTPKIISISEAGIKGKETIFLTLQHNKTIGIIEMSTAYAWNNSDENLSINTDKGIYSMTNHTKLYFTAKQGTIFGIPKEKVFTQNITQEILYDSTGFMPIIDNSQSVAQGYCGEISTFLDLCEFSKGNNLSAPSDIIDTFMIMNSIKNFRNV